MDFELKTKPKAPAVKLFCWLRLLLIPNEIPTPSTKRKIYLTSAARKKTIDQSHAFNWYHCDVLGSISYLVDLKENMACYNRFNTFNYLRTEDHAYCKQTKNWMQTLIMKSVSFSGQGEKHRNKYLYNAFAECDKLLMEINGH